MPATIDECTAESKWKFYITKMNSYRKSLEDSLYLGLVFQKKEYCMIVIKLFVQLNVFSTILCMTMLEGKGTI